MNKRVISVLAMTALLASFLALPAGDAAAKKKKKKKPKAPVCAAYTPGDMGAEAETIVVTKLHTADKPLAYPISLDPHFQEGVGADAPTANVNVQVDSAGASAGLYVTFEFQPRRDYDLWAYFPDGSGAASSHGFNPLDEAEAPQPVPFDPSNQRSNHGGESTPESENLVGITTPDCGGYTVQATNYFGEGGDFELMFWLGEGTIGPGVPG